MDTAGGALSGSPCGCSNDAFRRFWMQVPGTLAGAHSWDWSGPGSVFGFCHEPDPFFEALRRTLNLPETPVKDAELFELYTPREQEEDGSTMLLVIKPPLPRLTACQVRDAYASAYVEPGNVVYNVQGCVPHGRGAPEDRLDEHQGWKGDIWCHAVGPYVRHSMGKRTFQLCDGYQTSDYAMYDT